MHNSESYLRKGIENAKKSLRISRLLAVAIVFVMIASSFFAVAATTADEPEIWTSQDEYLPGEVVYIFGKGFVAFEPVTMNLSHEAFEPFGYKLYSVTPTLGGKFVFDDYTAEWLNSSEPVNVTASQVYKGETRIAYTEFKDPSALIQAWTLKPHLKWTTGNTAGYNEGDSVPMEVKLDKNRLGVSTVDITIGLDFIDVNDPSEPKYGFDFLTDAWWSGSPGIPGAPYNIHTNSSTPFSVDPSEGTILNQQRLANQYDSGSHQVLQVWNFTIEFAPGATKAYVKCGAHLALTSLPAGILGASYYSGSNLHLRMVDIVPDVGDEGNRDVPFPVKEILIPPKMNIEKNCTPCLVIEGDIITFDIHFNNTGQANAHALMWDEFPSIIDVIPGSFLYWSSENPVPIPPVPGPVISGNEWQWDIGVYPGTGADDGNPVLESYLQFQAVVNTSVEGCYVNWVYLNYTDDHGGIFPTEKDNCTFCIRGQPDISIEKSGPYYAHVGDMVTYTYVVTNTGYVNLVDVDVVDDVAGNVVLDDTLLTGETKTYTKTYVIGASDPDPLPNNVTATGTDDRGRVVEDNSSWLIDILHPMIDVEKWADRECAEIGEQIIYTITVANPSHDTVLYNVTVIDSFFDVIWAGTLLPGQTEGIMIAYTPDESTPDPLVNEVIAQGEDLLHLWVMDSDYWVIDILHPMISIDKWADKSCAEIGEEVTYWINVSNPSWDTEMYAEVYDPMFGGMIWSGYLLPGEWVNLSLVYIVSIGDPDPLENVVAVVAWDYQEHYVRDSDSWIVDIYHPMIDVEKWADMRCAAEGDIVIYTIVVMNPSPDTWMWYDLYDSLLGGYMGSGYLAPGGSDVYTIPYTVPYIPPADPGIWELYNYVFVDAWDAQYHYVYDCAEWWIDIYHPDIIIEKWADMECAAEGDIVTYTIVVTNPTLDTIMHYDAYDYLLGWVGAGTLAPGESHTYTMTYSVPYIPPDPSGLWELCNYVEVIAWDDQDHFVYGWAEWWIDVYHPDIIVDKWADIECAAEGDVVTYTIVVTNPSLDTWMYYDLYDPLLGGYIGSGYLAPGESHTYTLTYIVPYIPPDPTGAWELYNEVWVDAWDDQWHYVFAWDYWLIDIYHPEIIVDKWADMECAAEGDTVTYTIVVTNPSLDTWMNYDLYDSLLGGYLGSGYLAPGASDVYTLTYVVPYIPPDPSGAWELYNEAWVDAWDDQWHYVFAWDYWLIDIYHPAIDVEKWSEFYCAAEGDVIEYIITVTNPSLDTWMYYNVYDSLVGWSASGSLAPGETHTYTLTYVVPYIPPDPTGAWELYNEVYVEAWDDQCHYVWDWDYWLIDIYHPDIIVDKWADVECAAEGDVVTYTIVVTNPSLDTWMYYDLYDPLLGGYISSGYLAPGESHTYTLTYIVPYIPPDPTGAWELYNEVWVDAWDDQWHYVFAWDYWLIDIYHPAIDVEKWSEFYCAAEGDVIEYIITVTNPSLDTWMNYDLYDSLLGGYLGSGYLAPGETHTYTLTYIVPYIPPDPGYWELYNEVWVDAWDDQWHYACDWDYWYIDIYHPAIDVMKWADVECAAEGDIVTYTIVVTNPSLDTWMNYDVYDWYLGWIGNGYLAPGESHTYTITYTVPYIPPDPGYWELYNEVWVDAWDDQGHYVFDWDYWLIDIYHPAIDVEKWSEFYCAAEGDVIEYIITVTNPSLDTWMYYDLYESLWGGYIGSGSLAPGETHTYTLTYVVPYIPPEPAGYWELYNEVWVDAWDDQGHYVFDWDYWLIDIYHPDIIVEKWADMECAAEGDVVTYTIVVTNPSLDTWMNYDLYDSLLGGYIGSGYLAPGESHTYTLTYIVPYIPPDPTGAWELYNEVWVDAWDDQWHYVFGWDYWLIDIYHPDIFVDKWSEFYCAAEGDVIEYIIEITNPSLDTVMYYDANDWLLGWIGSGSLLPGETHTYVIPYTVPYIPPDPTGAWELYNEVWVDAWDDQGHYVWDWDYWYIDIYHPAIEVVKYADLECAAEGDVVTYTIVVTNPSLDTWMNYDVYDWYLGWIGSGYLAPGESHTYTITYTVPYIPPDPTGWPELYNEVWVDAWDDQWHYVFAWDYCYIDILHPAIVVDKWADVECAAEGDVVTYTIVVSNPSLDTGMYYDLYDYLLGDPITGYIGSGYLAPGESHTYVITYTVPYIVPDPFGWPELYNFVEVLAWDYQLHWAYDWAEWWIDILHPEINVIKTAEKSCAHIGENVTYFITVSNPSADTWMDFVLIDSLMGVIWGAGTGILGDKWSDPYWTLAPGESVTFGGESAYDTIWQDGYVYIAKLEYTVLETDPDPLINTAWVEAWDYQDHYVYDEDSHEVDILHPAILLTKEGPLEAAAGETITYYVNVTNIAPDTVLYNVTVTDTNIVGPLAFIPMLGIGVTAYITYTLIVPGGISSLYNEACAVGEDKQHVWVRDCDSWEVFIYGQVNGYKFADLNLNSLMDGAEPGLVNWLIVLNGVLDSGGFDNRTRLTDSFGYYEFTNLRAGTYTVQEVMLSGWKNTTAKIYSFVINGGESLPRIFGNIPAGNISGYKWGDCDMDGVWDPDEDPIMGWIIYLVGIDFNGNPVSAWTVTDSSGKYMFKDLLPGVYNITEEDRAGWFHTTPSTIVVDVSGLDPFEITDQDFGNVKYGRITGFKWLDEYMNGVRDGNEPQLPGWTIVLTGVLVNGLIYGPVTTVTDANGTYSFDNLLPGEYHVWEIIPEGWTNVTPSEWYITITCGYVFTCAKFGNVPLGYITGWKFLDWDMDTGKDGDEPGIPGWAITLTGWLNDGDWPYSPVNATHVGPITIYTDANGSWAFYNLLPGVYTVTEESRPGWYHTTPSSFTIWIAPGTMVYDVKFGNVPYTCIWGYKFNDLNGNGENEDEPGLGGWIIVLEGMQNDGEYIYLEMETDRDGYFATCFNILPGEYVIYEILQEGWRNTTPYYYYITIPPYIELFEPIEIYVEFGNFKLGKIFGWKYEDMDGDGILDPEDTPIEGWGIYLLLPWGGIGYTTTNETGYYEFSGLLYGLYYVYEEDRINWIHTSPSGYTVMVMSGDVIEIPVFLNTELGKIYGYKFEDLNSNGIWDEGEPGIPRWTIYMIWDYDPTIYTTTTDGNGYYEFTGLLPDPMCLIWEEERLGWTPTNDTWEIVSILSGDVKRIHDFGNFKNVTIIVFKFEDIWSDGVYDEGEDIPIEGWNITVSGPGIPGGSIVLVTGPDGLASIEVSVAGNYTITEEDRERWNHTNPPERVIEIQSGDVPPVIEFGNFRCIEIIIFKYEDVDSDGKYNASIDNPLPGWTIGIHSIWGYTEYYTTDENGLVTITFCSADWIIIFEDLPEGWCMITPEMGDYEVMIWSRTAWDMYLDEERYYYEFGNFECVEIIIFKYWDKCSNGWYDPSLGDEPIEGWPFWIFGPASMGFVAWTDHEGYISVIICKAGLYIIMEEDREGWSHIVPLNGTYYVYVESGDGVIVLWFGNYLHVDVPIFKYEDVNSNGVYDAGDWPIEGWYFEMKRAGDDVTFSGYTDASGMLILTVNRSGIYTITEEDRAGWTHINPANGMRVVSIISGTIVPVQEFGNFRDTDIWVFKYEDVDGDGYYTEGIDRPLPGWEFTLGGGGGGGCVNVTDAFGYASFTVNRSGWYNVTEEDRDGWCHTTPPILSVYVESGYAEPWLLMYGNFKCVNITVFKYEDVNGNGVYDDGDRPLEGWEINVVGFHYGYYYMVNYTDAGGYANFTLCDAGWFEIYETLKNGWRQTAPEWGYYEIWVYSGDEFGVFEFGNFKCVNITVFKYEDFNSNGIYDDGDSPVPGWEFFLYDPTGLWYASAVTDVNGYAGFVVCMAGNWTIVEERRPWVSPINPASGYMVVSVVSGIDIGPLMFGNFWHVWIPVFKYNDLNSNGVYDEGDVPIEGWNFTVTGPGVIGPGWALTDEFGYACFEVNRSGDYLVKEEDRAGWSHINPASGEITVTIYSGVIFIEPLMFGNFHDVYIIIFKFDDMNANGVYEPWDGDVPLPGWNYEIWFWVDGVGWVLLTVMTTNETGYAEYIVNRSGWYVAVEIVQEGWWVIKPVEGYYEFYVYSCMCFVYLEFANFKLGKIYGYKWNDLNGNGEWEVGEPPLANWTISFETLGGGMYMYGTTMTNETGYYEFYGLPAGTYEVWEDVQSGWMPTTPPSVVVTIIGHTEVRVDFGNFKLGCIEGYKFEDYNGNGIYDDGDMPLEGWTIYLSITGYTMTPEGPISFITIIAIVTTNETGYYRFCGLGPGTYVVSEESRTGWIATNATSETVVMTSGAYITIHDFMNFELGWICGWKFEDLNSNGIWDLDEPAIEGWRIYMIRDALPAVSMITTDENGFFCFDDLEADYYIIWEENRLGWTPTTYTWAMVDIFSGTQIILDPFGNFKNVTIEIFKYEDVNGNGIYDNGDVPIEGWMFTVSGPCFPTPLIVYTGPDGWVYVEVCAAGTYVVTEEDRPGWMHVVPASGSIMVNITSGILLRPLYFGNFKLGEITGQKFYDVNRNGIKDEGEVGLASWIIWINGTLVGGGYLNITRITDSGGGFEVTGLPAGMYVVTERLEYAPAGWHPTTPTAYLVLIGSGSTASLSFGNVIWGLIYGYKFYDKDLDGFMDEGEPGLDGWTIVLEGVTDHGTSVYRTTVTSGGGMYVFDEVQPGTYNVTEIMPGNWVNTTTLPIIIDVSGTMVYFEIRADIGNVRYCWIHGYKFLDTYEESYPFWPNGLFDLDEFGLGNWEITLEGWTATGEYVQRVTYTDNLVNIGYYEFKNVLPGTYWINETLLVGYYATKPISVMIMIYPHPMGPFEIVIEFGNLIPAPDPEIMFVLESGWNLWSAPIVVEGLTAAGLLDAVGPCGLMVSKLNKTTGLYESYVDSYDEDFPIVYGEGYYIWATQKVMFSLMGVLEASSESELVAGWNIIGYNQLQPTTASDLMSKVEGCTAWMISYLDAETGQYYSYVDSHDYDFTVTPGRAYFLWVDGPGTIVFG